MHSLIEIKNMSYTIIRNHFAVMSRQWHDEINTAHAIIYRNCNFHCEFCNNDFRPENQYKQYDHDEFVSVVCGLLPYGKYFKFTGGEPTVNPELARDIKIVKDLGGFVFLDTNGSFPNIVKNLVDNKLVDVIGISLKGLSLEQAQNKTCVKMAKFCWDNVWQTIQYCNNHIKTIVTYVVDDHTTYNDILKFYDILSPFNKTTIKINNLMFDKHHSENVKAISENKIESYVDMLIHQHPSVSGRLIYVPNECAIVDYSKIKFY